MRWIPWLCLLVPALGQDVISSVRVESVPFGAPFYVDGQRYTTPQVFFWATGSKHTIEGVADPLIASLPVEYYFEAWEDNTGQLNTSERSLQVTASPKLTKYQAKYQKMCRLDIDLEAGSGTVSIDAETIASSRHLYVEAGSELTLVARPAPGWVFQRWHPNNVPESAPVTKFRVTAPYRLHPVFGRSRRARILTEPPGRQVYVERTLVDTPFEADWAFHGTYQLAAPSPQQDSSGRLWLLDRWSFGGGQNSSYTVTSAGDFTLTATFQRAGRAAFFTEPPQLRLRIDGRENHFNYEFAWAVGSEHTVEAPAEQSDSAGRRWMFKGWKHGGPAEQTYKMTLEDADRGRTTWLAHYEQMPRLTIEAPSEVVMDVDGVPCATPCRVERKAGSAVRIHAPEIVGLSADSRLEFTGWNGTSGSAELEITPEGDQWIRADYRGTHRLHAVTAPPDAATFVFNPAEYAPEDDVATVKVSPKPGYRFRHWEGDAWTSANPVNVFMSQPRTVRAVLESVPWVDPRGVQNAAGRTPDNVLAPGSRVLIAGLNLASSIEIAKTDPIPETLADVAVTWEGKPLPLISISPEAIETVLPWSMPEGTTRLWVHRTGYQEVAAEAQIVRNAPGLYENIVDEGNGSFKLLATGAGPYTRQPESGHLIPPDFAATLLDPIEVEVDNMVISHESTGPLADHVGMAAVHIRLPADAKEIRLRANGRLSNTIALSK